MKEIQVGRNEAGKRLDKLLGKVLNQAPSSFVYKMLRKKNIKLNEKRAEGKELLKEGDRIQIYLSDETYARFHADETPVVMNGTLDPKRIIYQDKDVLIVNKPSGVLSQKAQTRDDSMNEQILRYLLKEHAITEEQLKTFVPSVCNRLDRNTSGILLAGVSLPGSRELSRMLKDRSLSKYYLALVAGEVTQAVHTTAYLKKDNRQNRVTVSEQEVPGADRIETWYRPVLIGREYTLLEVQLITGKSHQIRAHLAALGYPILGDPKYGDVEKNRRLREQHRIQSQCLHAYRVVFPDKAGELEQLSGKTFQAQLPNAMDALIRHIWKKSVNQEGI